MKPRVALFCSLCFFTIFSDCLGQENWTYLYSGNDWGGVCSSGRSQSPVDITSERIKDVFWSQPLVFINYDRPLSFKLSWIHNTVKIFLSQMDCQVGIAGGGLRGLYLLDHIHFHWSSEHMFNSQRLPLEIHFVHYRSNYPNVSEALSDPQGIAVLGVLVVEGEGNSGLENIEPGMKAGVASLTPRLLLPEDVAQFYRYTGSLTTPPCSEVVTWSIFRTYYTAPLEQILFFKNFQLSRSFGYDNFRKVQPLNSREIELWLTTPFNQASSIPDTNSILKYLPCLIAIFRFINTSGLTLDASLKQ